MRKPLLEVLHAERLCALAAARKEIEACKEIIKRGDPEPPVVEGGIVEVEVRNTCRADLLSGDQRLLRGMCKKLRLRTASWVA